MAVVVEFDAEGHGGQVAESSAVGQKRKAPPIRAGLFQLDDFPITGRGIRVAVALGIGFRATRLAGLPSRKGGR